VISFHKAPPIVRVIPGQKISDSNNRLIQDILSYCDLITEISQEALKLKNYVIRMEASYNWNYDSWLEELNKQGKNTSNLMYISINLARSSLQSLVRTSA
jgi:hypothetical protein